MSEFQPSPLEKKIEHSEEVFLSGQIYNKEVKEKYQILYLKNNSIKCQEQFLKESQIIIYDKEKNNVHIGQKIKVSGEAGFFEPARNPGNFDSKMYYRGKGVHAYIWASELQITDERTAVFQDMLYEFRQKCYKIYMENMDEKEAGVLSAMLLGEKGGMDTELRELYQVNGIGHVLAISGLHLSFIGIGLYRILRRTTGSYMAGGIAGCVFLLLYLFMTGFTISAVRAFVMFLFRVGADIVGRHYDSLTALTVAAVVVLIWRPLSVYDGGFWLSFGAVLAILIVFPMFSLLPFQGLWASVSVNLVLLPVFFYYFYEFSFYSTVLNLFIIPLMSVLLFFGIFGGILCAFSGVAEVLACLGKLILEVCGLILGIYEKSCGLVLDFPGARIVTGQPEVWQIAGYYTALVIAGALWRCGQKNSRERDCSQVQIQKGKNQKIKVYVCRVIASVVLVTGTVLFLYRYSEENCLHITMLDVGQGDGIFMQGPAGTTYFVDGGSSDVKSVGKYRMEPYLLSKGVKRLDYVFISHGDGDHINGIREMLIRQRTGVEIGTLVFPAESVWDNGLKALAGEAKKEGVKTVVIEPGQRLVEEKLEISCIGPGADYEGETGNEASMILAVAFGEFDMLFTGDVEGKGEELLTDMIRGKYTDTRWEVLKVAHHGSKNSSSESFLAEISPMYALISAGKENSYGHPHDETLERLAHIRCKVYCTQESGAIEIIVEEDKMMLRKQLN